MSFVHLLPVELIEEIFSYLPLKDLVTVSEVSLSWYNASNSIFIWKSAIKKAITRGDLPSSCCDVDRFVGVASNYDDSTCFSADRPSHSRLPPINPWKLSVCQNMFVRSNWKGQHATMVARHQVSIPNSVIMAMQVDLPSKSPQDRLYFPVFARKLNQTEFDFYLIRLDGTPQIARTLFTTACLVPVACIDRDCVVWVEISAQLPVKCLALGEQVDSSEIQHLGNLVSVVSPLRGEFFFISNYTLTMDANYIVGNFTFNSMKVWCKKTYQLKYTFIPGDKLHCPGYYLLNGCLYIGMHKFYWDDDYQDHVSYSVLQIYDIKEDKLHTDADTDVYSDDPCIMNIVFSDLYYVIVSKGVDFGANRISVYLVANNKFLNYLTDIDELFCENVWIAGDSVLFIDGCNLNSLDINCNYVSESVTKKLTFGKHVPRAKTMCKYYVWDDLILASWENNVEIYDWTKGSKLQRLILDTSIETERKFILNVYNDEMKLVAVNQSAVTVMGFW